MSYDSDGDPLSDPVSGFTNAYNAEGRATTFDNVAVTYDALNRAVEAGGQEFIYGPSGTKIAVMNGQTLVRADIPLVGGAEAIYNSSGFVAYRHTDLLGSSRLATNYNGGLYSETALAPYGEPLLETGTHDRSFTGAKQDIANGTAPSSDANGDDDFLAREYSPTQSRWWTPDPAGLAAVDPDDPQSWNRYSYACDPLNFADATGGKGTCTLSVNLANYSNASPHDITAIEQRVNSIFAATPTSAGDITQISFTDTDAAYTLNLFAASFKAGGLSPTQGDSVQGGYTAWVYWANTERYTRLGGIPGAAALVAGTDAAHELIHDVANVDDVDYGEIRTNPELMSDDTVPLWDSAACNQVFHDYTTVGPTGFSKLTGGEANSLYNACIHLKLRPPSQGGSLGGAAGNFVLNSPGYNPLWYFEFLQWQSKYCPFGGCRK